MNTKKIVMFLITLLMVTALTACSATVTGQVSETTSNQSANASAAQAASTNGDTTSQSETSSASPSPVPEEGAVNSFDTHEDEDDYVIDAVAAVVITFNGDSISASGECVSVDGTTVTITAPGDYRLSGTLADGQVVVNSTEKGAVRLILDGVTLSNSTSAPVYITDASKVILLLADGTQNTVSDASNYVYPSAEVDEPNATIFSNADLSIAGSGTLTVTGNFNDGINAEDGLVVASGNLIINAVDDGLRGKDYLVVTGGVLNITAGGDGLKSDNSEDTSLGTIGVSGGSLTVNSGGDAFSAQTTVTVSGGEVNLTTGGGSGNLVAETESAKGIKGDAGVVIEGGSFTINAADDALHSNGSITINNGSFILASSDDTAHADQSLTVNGGDLTVTTSYEGLESAVININGGSMHISASDDGINVAGGVDSSGMMRGILQPGGQDTASYSGSYYLYVNGGWVWIDAQGDGIDVGGMIEMTDGVVLVNGPTQNGNGALDYDGDFTMSGGLIIAVGSSGMAMTAGQSSTQNAVLVNLPNMQSGGTPVTVTDSSGAVVFTFTPTRNYQSLAFSSPKLVTGETYTVYTGGSNSGSATDGLVTDGSYTPGTQAATFTINSTVTGSGAGGGGGMMGPGGGRPGGGPRR